MENGLDGSRVGAGKNVTSVLLEGAGFGGGPSYGGGDGNMEKLSHLWYNLKRDLVVFAYNRLHVG